MNATTNCPVHGKPFLPEGKGLWEVYHLGCDYPSGSCDCWCGTYCRKLEITGLVVRDESALLREVLMDIGKQVAHHIEIMYPEAVKAASSTFLLSVRNAVYNEIMAAMERNNTEQMLAFHKAFRRKQKAAYKNIRASPPVAGTSQKED